MRDYWKLYSNEVPEKYIDFTSCEVKYPCFTFELCSTDINIVDTVASYSCRIWDSRYIKFFGYTFDIPKELLGV